MQSKNRRSSREKKEDYEFEDDDKQQINAIVCRKSMVIIFNIFFMVKIN
jgi:hypothetical protein